MTLLVLLASKHTPSLDVSPGSELLSVLFPVEQGHGFRAREMQNWFAQGCFRNWRCLPFQISPGWRQAGCCSSTAAPSRPRTRPTWGRLLSWLPHSCHADLQEPQFLAAASPTRPSSPTVVPAPASAQLGSSRMMSSGAGQPLLQPLHHVHGAMALGTPPLRSPPRPPWLSSVLAPGIRAPNAAGRPTSFWGLRPTTKSTSVLRISHAL